MKWFKLEPALIGSAAAAVYAVVVMAVRAYQHTGVFEPDLLVAAGSALWLVWTRSKVTPLALPRDNEGRPLTSASLDAG